MEDECKCPGIEDGVRALEMPRPRNQNRKKRYSQDAKLGGTHRILQWPLLIGILCILFLQLLFYSLLRAAVSLYETLVNLFTPSAQKSSHKALQNATSYVQWAKHAKLLDKAQKREEWKLTPASDYYDHERISVLMHKLVQAREQEDAPKLRQLLTDQVFHTHRVWAGFDKASLYSQTYFGTKRFVYEFLEEVLQAVAALQHLCQSPQEMERFAQLCFRGYGRTALCLSGGGSMGYYHFGTLKALLDMGLLPTIISGASAGAMVACWAATRTDEQLHALLQDTQLLASFLRPFSETWPHRFYRLVTRGCLFSNDRFRDMLLVATRGNTTFLEAYRISGRILCIPVTSSRKHSGRLVLNYRTAPDVCIWSAVLASCSIPGLLQPARLVGKRAGSEELFVEQAFGETWCDGSILNDVPKQELTEQFGVSRFIVCQVNPHIAPFIYESRGACGEPSPHRFGSRLRGGFLLASLESLLKLEMRKWLRLIRELDLVPFGLDLRSLWLQHFGGDVTLHPRMRNGLLWAYTQMASDPSPKTLERFMLEGQRMTWPKLSMISNHFILERILDTFLRENPVPSPPLSSIRPLR